MRESSGAVTNGLADLHDGLQRRHLWMFLAWRDVANRYQRSLIGPLWLTVTSSVFLVAVGFVYSRLFGADITAYFPYLTAGFLTWVVLTTLLNEMALAYVGSIHYALNLNAPRSIYLFRVLARNGMMAMHLIPIWVAVMLLFQVPITWSMLLVVPGAALSIGTIFSAGVVVAVASARFRDVPMILSSVVQVLFFVTPVMWQESLIPESALWVVKVNPFVPLLNLVREPLLGVQPATETWALGLMLFSVSSMVALGVYSRFQRRLTYWL